jgi:hypothetical protein
MKAKKGQQVFLATHIRPELPFITGDFIRETKDKIYIKDYEFGNIEEFDKAAFKIIRIKKKLGKVV